MKRTTKTITKTTTTTEVTLLQGVTLHIETNTENPFALVSLTAGRTASFSGTAYEIREMAKMLFATASQMDGQ